MVQILIAGHGTIAQDLLNAAETIIGPIEGVCTIARLPVDGKKELIQKFEQMIARLDSPSGILVLTDAYGGSAFNIASSFLDKRLRIVTGMNLPMILDLATSREKMSLERLATRLAKIGRRSVMVRHKTIIRTNLRNAVK